MSSLVLESNHNQIELPTPDAIALEVSQQLVEKIKADIDEAGGNISFKRFMEISLYEPGLGYYSAGSRKFGGEGDFITAPELSSLFSICLARQCEQILRLLKNGLILEIGAGTASMACDVLIELKRMKCLPSKYFILETSADLRQRQQRRIKEQIPELLNKVEWLDTIPDGLFNGVILANEVLDALPVHRVTIIDNKLYEINVSWEEDGFTWLAVEAGEHLASRFNHVQNESEISFPNNYITEINTDLDFWINSFSIPMESGAVFLIDYGYPRNEYYHSQRNDGTLTCHYRHRVHNDPFLFPGLQDLTSSVDFTAVAEAAVDAGLNISGFTTQAHFLMSCGLDDVISSRTSNDEKEFMEMTQQAKILTLPSEMGERFKVIALTKKIDKPLLGFTMADHRQRL